MSKKYIFPQDLEKLKTDVLNVISPLIPVNDESPAPIDFFTKIQRTNAGRNLGSFPITGALTVQQQSTLTRVL